VQQQQYIPPPLTLTPGHFHKEGSPTLDIIEHPIIREDPTLSVASGSSNTTDSSFNPPVIISEPSEAIPSTSDNFYEDIHDQETIPFINNIDFADLINADDLGELYEPVVEESQDINNVE